jgi:hypothetical protein
VNTLERRLGVAATALIFAVAGSTSYYHLGELALAVGLPALLAWTLPSTVDTLMFVALVNLNRPGASRWNWLALGVGLLVSCAGNIFAVTDLVPIDTLRVAVAAWPPLCLAILKLATRSAKPAAPVAAPVVSGEVRDSTPSDIHRTTSPEASEPVSAPVAVPEPEPVPVPVLTLEPAPEPVSEPVVVVAAVEPSVALPVAPTDAKAARQAQVRELFAAGWSNAEMATELGCTPKTISRDLSELGLVRPSPSTNGAHPEPVGAS